MPNWCSNTVILSHEDSTKIDDLEKAVLRSLDTNDDFEAVLDHLRPNPDGEWNYGWSIENWGTKWDVHVHHWDRVDANTFEMDFDSAWSPPTTLYDYLVENDWNVEAKYEEPGMTFVGEYIDGHDESYEYDFSDPDWADEIPEHLRDYAGLDSAYEDWQEWQDDLDEIEEDEEEVD